MQNGNQGWQHKGKATWSLGGCHTYSESEVVTGDSQQTLEICTLVIDDHQEMLTRALSWALRELAKVDKGTVERQQAIIMKFVCALITVSDIERSRYFYEKVLGQKIKLDLGENITFHGDFAIHLRSHFEKLIDNKKIEAGSNNFELYFEYDDLEEMEGKLNKEGVKFVHDIREQPWRQKVMRCYDPDGNMIEIGESIEHLSYRLHMEGMEVDEISKTTNMPPDFVKTSIGIFKP